MSIGLCKRQCINTVTAPLHKYNCKWQNENATKFVTHGNDCAYNLTEIPGHENWDKISEQQKTFQNKQHGKIDSG